MLIPFDDYPVHQTSLPLAQTGSGNPHQYDRFWFNGFREDVMFGIAFCSYPNRELMDGAFSVAHNGRQHSVFASCRRRLSVSRGRCPSVVGWLVAGPGSDLSEASVCGV
jgi:hypothetical protein